jgi:hypothetical protein
MYTKKLKVHHDSNKLIDDRLGVLYIRLLRIANICVREYICLYWIFSIYNKYVFIKKVYK